jgi:hypothetical protein
VEIRGETPLLTGSKVRAARLRGRAAISPVPRGPVAWGGIAVASEAEADPVPPIAVVSGPVEAAVAVAREVPIASATAAWVAVHRVAVDLAASTAATRAPAGAVDHPAWAAVAGAAEDSVVGAGEDSVVEAAEVVEAGVVAAEEVAAAGSK